MLRCRNSYMVLTVANCTMCITVYSTTNTEHRNSTYRQHTKREMPRIIYSSTSLEAREIQYAFSVLYITSITDR